ncbi:MAG: glucose-6-phosphate dehydrogenase assembly protein OpcA [Planctomycetes bacterium]|nr:glucose-6-phosphate dehydrogenase assembly protein OpcA [Planctomycetota bacterium]
MAEAVMAGGGGADFLSGVPIAVDPGAIERELARLWKPAEPGEEVASAVTRACLSNLIVYLPDEAALERAEACLPGLARRFPSRRILLTRRMGAERSGLPSRGSGLAAWISAVCHVPAPGAPPICCEQIALELESPPGDESFETLAGAAVQLLVPDVPVNLFVPSDGGDRLVELLAQVLDRVVFDSRALALTGLRRLAAALSAAGPCGADDLAWRAGAGWRRALCDLFDDPGARPLLGTLRSVDVAHARGSPVRAALLAGWLASRLEGPARRLAVALRPVDGESLPPGEVRSARLEAGRGPGGAFLEVQRLPGKDVLRVQHLTKVACVLPHAIPFRPEGDSELLGSAIERTTHQGVLRAAVERALRLA